MRYSRMRLSHKLVLIAIFTALLVGYMVLRVPTLTADPAASPQDDAQEDLSRVEYPSLKDVKWHAHFIKPNESLESLFGADWVHVARFNRIDRRHVYPGMTIKVPDDIAASRGYTPMPKQYEPARRYDKYILVDLTEQWLGAYENGRLVFSTPAATGKAGNETPTGLFRITARHLTHTSSLYKTANDEEQYPMDNAMRFHVGPDGVSYWLHARDLPGRPASHGCIGLYDEEMQKRMFNNPLNPVLIDSQKLYSWAVGEDEYGEDSGNVEELEDGPLVEVRGTLPRYLERSPVP
ncbi:L,D-transpeptidase [Pelobacter propionicus]|uniref:ErfK/YbiS/YcfS/YnhG family protein n=1 Tax=Pelobacter propionicus (strain DSM 2379 / NBRC 103807 / OttBd1) TaxID=338966 RepID=A1AL87_PELPD|nr:ErfK/YbiS/YcfS/YnhG family protein [Pelobacter propionicus DSM 2379]